MNYNASRRATTRPAYYTEDARPLTRRGVLFNVLADGGWHDADELARVGGISLHASLHRFRRAGWQIESERAGRRWRYRMTGLQQDGGATHAV